MSRPQGPPQGRPAWQGGSPPRQQPQQPPDWQSAPPPQPVWDRAWKPPHQPVPAAVPAAAPGQQPPGVGGPGGVSSGGAPGRRVLRARRNWFLSGAFVLVAVLLVLVLGFVAPGWFVRTVFQSESVQRGVARTLRDVYQLNGVRAVSCPDGQTVVPGNQFDCRVRFDDRAKTVTISVKDDRGVYEVGHPK